MGLTANRAPVAIAAAVVLVAALAVVVFVAGLPRIIGDIWPNLAFS